MTIKLDITPEKLFIIGYIGSDRMRVGKEAANLLGYELLVLDDLIVKKDGRPLKKLIMAMGEHEYRNREYEILETYSKKKGFVMAVSYTHLRAHETRHDLVCRLLLEKKKKKKKN